MSHASNARMPVIFFGHGSPMNTLASNRYTDAWSRLGASVPRPKAILAISAHWLTRGTAVTGMAVAVDGYEAGSLGMLTASAGIVAG